MPIKLEILSNQCLLFAVSIWIMYPWSKICFPEIVYFISMSTIKSWLLTCMSQASVLIIFHEFWCCVNTWACWVTWATITATLAFSFSATAVLSPIFCNSFSISTPAAASSLSFSASSPCAKVQNLHHVLANLSFMLLCHALCLSVQGGVPTIRRPKSLLCVNYTCGSLDQITKGSMQASLQIWCHNIGESSQAQNKNCCRQLDVLASLQVRSFILLWWLSQNLGSEHETLAVSFYNFASLRVWSSDSVPVYFLQSQEIRCNLHRICLTLQLLTK